MHYIILLKKPNFEDTETVFSRVPFKNYDIAQMPSNHNFSESQYLDCIIERIHFTNFYITYS